jgi:chromosome segregation ATPase
MADSPTKLIRETQQEVKVLAERVDGLRHELSQLSLPELRDRMSLLAERLAVTEDRVNKLEKTKEEAEKRHWQFVYIVLGAALALLSSLLVNLLLLLVKK